MKRSRRNVAPIFLALLYIALAGGEQVFSQSSTMKPPSIVKVQAFVSRDPIPQDTKFEVALVAHIAPGFHMNAHKTSDPYLIPTTIEGTLPPGFSQSTALYPPGKLRRFDFSTSPLNVYEGTVTLRVSISASSTAKQGDTQLPFTLRYQACNATTCFPPARISVPVELKVVAKGSTSKEVHPEIFSRP